MSTEHLARQFPWTTVILVTTCMVCHLLVLSGNIATAFTFEQIGDSSRGWSNLGLDMAATFATEIDYAMANMTDMLTDGIEQIVALEEMLDFVIGVMGQQTERSLLQVASLLQDPGNSSDTTAAQATATIDSFPVPLPDGLKNVAKVVAGAAAAVASSGATDPMSMVRAFLEMLMDTLMQQVNDALDTFLDIMEPALLKVGEWFTKFGDKVQAGIEMFSTTIDMVEKMIDQIMAQSGGGGENAEYMEYNTYNLFAVSDPTTGISVQDLKDVSSIYSITSLQGSKAEDLHAKYDSNQDAVIDKEEFALFVEDTSIPGVMAVVLRSYAKRLSQVAGQVGGAKLRDEVANSVVKYLQLVAAKNITKVGWISERLTNRSLPMAFTADVMRNLALAQDDPEVLTTSDVGAKVVGMMASMDHTATIEAADLMSDAEFWVAEGFDPADQPVCVERVTKWTAMSLIETGSWEGLRKLHATVGVEGLPPSNLSLLEVGTQGTASVVESTAAASRQLVERKQRIYRRERRAQLVARHEALTGGRISRYLFNNLLGGRTVLHTDPMTTQAVNSGVPAVPATLEFARFLSWNATDCSHEFQSATFNYSGMSSTPADAFATQIEGMVKKTQGFMSMLDDYAGPEGMERLRNKTHSYIEDAKAELLDVIISQLDKGVSSLQFQASSGGELTHSRAEVAMLLAFDAAEFQPAAIGGGTWQAMINMLQQVQAILPPCIENLKVARKEVSAVSKTLDSVFTTFKEQGLPIFKKIARYYALIWVVYFLLLSIFTMGILYYGFWASGYFGGPIPYDEKARGEHPAEGEEALEYEPPATCGDRMKTLCTGCWSWCCTCCSGECCFWSMLLMGQLFVLIIFLVALLLTIISGLKMFLASGCAAIYVLGDEKVCTETLKMIQNWVTTFNGGAPDLQIEQVCVSHSLMTCHVIANRLKTSAIITIIGAIVASVLSFQLLIESAILHERARMRRIVFKLQMEEDSDNSPP